MGVIDEEAVIEVALFRQVQQYLEEEMVEQRFLDDILGKFKVYLRMVLWGLADNVGITEREEDE